MALQSAYQQFLAAPNPSLLADDASLHYITTLTTFNGASAIVKHLNSQSHELKKKEEKVLDVVEGTNGLAVEVHTTIEFETGGGAFLPNLDDNFLADRVVTFPIIHIVSFDANGKILQIRQNWDQGSLLKLIDVIGKTGRNWPIRDGKDQIKLINNSVKSAGKTNSSANADESTVRSRGNSNNVTRDPHASLSLFAPREKNMQDTLPAVVAPRASAKPAPRDYSELFVGNDSDGSQPSPTRAAARERSQSPGKVMAKAGAGKHYAPSRLFDVEDEQESPIRPSPAKDHSADHFYRPNPKKYEHFNLADGNQKAVAPGQTPLKAVKSAKHSSQWNFDDFNTPAKVVPTKTLRTNDVRHWGNSDDEVVDSPIKMKKVDKPRKDAVTHFEFVDDGTPKNERALIGRPRGAGANTGMGLYKNNLYDDDEGVAGSEEPKGIKPISNVKDRRKDFDPQFTMTDDSPAGKPAPQPLAEDRAKAVKMMDANWAAYDQSPSQKENFGPTSPTSSRPTTANKGPLSEATNVISHRTEQPKGINIAGDGMGSRKGNGAQAIQAKGINIGGDGMGGKKGAGRQWGFGDESDGEEAGGVNKPGKYRTGKTQGKAQATGGDFWDF
ncbi:hypothetical protein B0J14DRAFT_516136 [Halenospora varia]|nr:hypothetical protein B0J14DRAFT_516136 [Halenospora varia]